MAVAVAAVAMFVGAATAQNKEPIKIGFSMALTGPARRRMASKRCSA